jgi:hypothetical protein
MKRNYSNDKPNNGVVILSEAKDLWLIPVPNIRIQRCFASLNMTLSNLVIKHDPA